MLFNLHGADFRGGVGTKGDGERAIDQFTDFGATNGFAGTAAIFEVNQDLKRIDALGVEILEARCLILRVSRNGQASGGDKGKGEAGVDHGASFHAFAGECGKQRLDARRPVLRRSVRPGWLPIRSPVAMRPACLYPAA